MDNKILAVDLDHTFHSVDLAWEKCFWVLKNKPYYFFHLFYWFVIGRPLLKKKLALLYPQERLLFPVIQETLDYILEKKKCGYKIYLISGSEESCVKYIADKYSFFDGYYGSSDTLNLISENKAKLILETFKGSYVEYMGDSSSDLKVFPRVDKGIWMKGKQNKHLETKMLNIKNVEVIEVLKKPYVLMQLKEKDFFQNV